MRCQCEADLPLMTPHQDPTGAIVRLVSNRHPRKVCHKILFWSKVQTLGGRQGQAMQKEKTPVYTIASNIETDILNTSRQYQLMLTPFLFYLRHMQS